MLQRWARLDDRRYLIHILLLHRWFQSGAALHSCQECIVRGSAQSCWSRITRTLVPPLGIDFDAWKFLFDDFSHAFPIKISALNMVVKNGNRD